MTDLVGKSMFITQEESAALCAHVMALVESCGVSKGGYGIGSLAQAFGLKVTDAQRMTDEDLGRMWDRVRIQGVISEDQLTALLGRLPRIKDEHRQDVECLIAWCVLSACVLELDGDSINAAQASFQQLRLLLAEDSEQLLKTPWSSLRFKELLGRAVDLGESARWAPVSCLLRYLDREYGQPNRPGGFRGDRQKEKGRGNTKALIVTAVPDGQQSEFADTYIIREEPKNSINGIKPAEHAVDCQGGRPLLAVANKAKTQWQLSRSARRRQARGFASRLTRSRVYALSDRELITRHALSVTLKECLTSMKTDDGALIVVLSILLGRNISRILGMLEGSSGGRSERLHVKGQDIYIQLWVELPRNTVARKLKKIYKLPTGKLRFHLPLVLIEPVKQLIARLETGGEAEREKVRKETVKFLATLRKDYGIWLSPGRLPRVLPEFLERASCDPAVRCWMLGAKACDFPEAFYTKVYQDDIDAQMQAYYGFLQEQCGREEIAMLQELAARTDCQGTRLQVEEAYLKRYVAEMNAELEKCMGSALDFHNALVLYIREALCLCTGWRPIRDLLQERCLIDWRGGSVYIADKEVRAVSSSRTAYLPPLMMELLKFYEVNLERLTYESRTTYPSLECYCEGALGRKKPKDDQFYPYLFLVDTDSGRIRQERMHPNILEERLSTRWPAALNWARHYIRDKLLQQLGDSELVGSLMAHCNFGLEADHRYSAISAGRRRQVSGATGVMLEELGFRTPAARWDTSLVRAA